RDAVVDDEKHAAERKNYAAPGTETRSLAAQAGDQHRPDRRHRDEDGALGGRGERERVGPEQLHHRDAEQAEADQRQAVLAARQDQTLAPGQHDHQRDCREQIAQRGIDGRRQNGQDVFRRRKGVAPDDDREQQPGVAAIGFQFHAPVPRSSTRRSSSASAPPSRPAASSSQRPSSQPPKRATRAASAGGPKKEPTFRSCVTTPFTVAISLGSRAWTGTLASTAAGSMPPMPEAAIAKATFAVTGSWLPKLRTPSRPMTTGMAAMISQRGTPRCIRAAEDVLPTTLIATTRAPPSAIHNSSRTPPSRR